MFNARWHGSTLHFWLDRSATAYRPDKWDLREGSDRHALAETNVALTARHIGPQSHRANRRSRPRSQDQVATSPVCLRKQTQQRGDESSVFARSSRSSPVGEPM